MDTFLFSVIIPDTPYMFQLEFLLIIRGKQLTYIQMVTMEMIVTDSAT